MDKKHNEILDDCSKLTVWRFNQVITTEDYKWLLSDYDGNDIESDVDLKSIWDKIVDEFNNLIGNGNAAVMIRKQMHLMKLQAKAYRVGVGVELYYSGKLNKENLKECAKHLKSDGYDIIKGKDSLKSELKALNNKIKWKSSEMGELLPKPVNTKKIDIDEQIFNLEKVTESPYPLDSKTLSVKRYAFLVKLARDRVNKATQHGK